MITLIGKDLAKKDSEFLFLKPAEDCENCRFKSSCIDSLEENRLYKIINVRENEQKCPIHDDNIVVPVEVEKSNITLLSNSKNIFEGATFTFNSPECDIDCEFKECCFPEGLMDEDKCIILKNHGKQDIECEKGYKLNKLTVGFVI